MNRIAALVGVFVLAHGAVAGELADDFRNPPHEARPQTWWHWVNGCVSMSGIKTELKAISDAGFGGVHFFNAGYGVNMPSSPEASFLSESWKSALLTALSECRKNGLDFTAQNGAGWSGSGGPWITPSNGMLCVYCTEARVKGGEKAVLPKPDAAKWSREFPTKAERWYGDVAALAFPLPSAYENEDPKVIRSVRIRWNRAKGRTARLMVSDNQMSWRRVAEFQAGEAAYSDADKPVSYAVAPIRAKCRKLEANEGAVVEATISSQPTLGNLNGQAASQAISISGGQDMADEPSAAVDLDEIRVVGDDVGADGTLSWTAPSDGRTWVFLRVGCCTNGRVNDPSPPGSSGPVGNLLDAAITRHHLDSYFSEILKAEQSIGGKVVRGLLLDSWESWTQNWAHDFPLEFARRRGYDLIRYLPVYAGYVVGTREASERYLFDARKTIDELLAERYFSVVADYCRQHGLVQSVEGFACGAGTFAGDPMTPGLMCDIPMTEGGQIREAPSAAHLMGGKLVSCEAHTGRADWGLGPRDLKLAEDDWFRKGVTRTVFHTYAHNAQPERRFPGPAFGGFGFCLQLGQTWWPHVGAWMDYLARCQAVLMRGTFFADVLAFTGEDRMGPLADFYGQMDCLKGLPPGYEYDHVPGPWLADNLSAAEDGTIGGQKTGRYRLLVLREHETALTVEVARKIRELVAGGGAVLGPKPTRSLGDLPHAAANDAEVRAIADEVWGACDGKSVSRHDYGKGVVFSGLTPGEALRALGVGPDFVAKGLEVGSEVEALHRKEGEKDIYFVLRRVPRKTGSEMGFRVTGKRPTILDPLKGAVIPAKTWREEGGYTYLPMVEGEAKEATRFVVFEKEDEKVEAVTGDCLNEGRRRTVAEVSGPWTIEFDNLGFQKKICIERLFDWAKHSDVNIAHYSGLAVYRKDVQLPVPSAERLILSLGRVDVSAEVFVDGWSAGVAWCYPYEVDVTAAARLAEGKPVKVEIRVANTWRNRLIADEALSPEKRMTWTSKTNVRADDRLSSSGLIGPVRLEVVEQ